MAEITDYKTWLSNVDIENDEDVYNLYSSVNNFEGSGIFYTSKHVQNHGSSYLVKAEGNEDVLSLESDEVKFAFLEYVASEYTDSEGGDIEKWYELKKQINKID